MSKKVIAKKPYCKVCYDAGKAESEYTSHWVKDLNGKTNCPTLLNTECRYCFKLGHTAKFCEALAKNNKKKDIRPSYDVVKKEEKKSTNVFMSLCEDSDHEEEVVKEKVVKEKVVKEKVVKEEFPYLCEPKFRTEVKTGWAAIAAIPKKVIEEPKISGLVNLSHYIKEEPKHVKFLKSWADWSDSEDERYEDDDW
jgi:hypothetical protein